MIAPTLLRRPLVTLLAILAVAGCSQNLPTAVLTPTGYRPGTPPGGIVISMLFDSLTYPGFVGTPYPLATVELRKLRNVAGEQQVDSIVASTTTTTTVREVTFSGVLPDTYVVRFDTHAFRTTDSQPILVKLLTLHPRPVFLPAQAESLFRIPYVVGTMPGFTLDDAQITSANVMAGPQVGVWEYPDLQIADYTLINAGTYRFKFCTDVSSSTPTNVIGWGGDPNVTLTAPLADEPVRYGSSPAEDIRVTIPTSGNWQFIFDERRLTFSITPAPASKAFAARARTPR